jgi:hypothetical protein
MSQKPAPFYNENPTKITSDGHDPENHHKYRDDVIGREQFTNEQEVYRS